MGRFGTSWENSCVKSMSRQGLMHRSNVHRPGCSAQRLTSHWETALVSDQRLPWRESILRPLQDGRQLGEVPQKHRRHVVVLDPIDPGLGVDGGRVVLGDEAIA